MRVTTGTSFRNIIVERKNLDPRKMAADRRLPSARRVGLSAERRKWNFFGEGNVSYSDVCTGVKIHQTVRLKGVCFIFL